MMHKLQESPPGNTYNCELTHIPKHYRIVSSYNAECVQVNEDEGPHYKEVVRIIRSG